MTVRFDPESSTLDLSVADLLDARLQRSLGFAHRGGYERMWLGQAIHSRYQEEALAGDPTYRREVALEVSFAHRGWEIRLRGRADGLRRDGDGTLVVEEIKSVRRGGHISPAVRELYEHQARLYAWMLSLAADKPVRPELLLIEIGSEVVEREVVELELRKVDRAVRRRLDSLLREHERRRASVAGRRGAGARLEFPYPRLRKGQAEILASIEESLGQRGHLLVEAPTGIGKTAAALFPVLRFALQEDKRVFVLTAKTLQQEMAMAVLELLNGEEAFHSLRLRAKAKMCANDEIICHEEYCPYARDYYAKLHSSQVVSRTLGLSRTMLPEQVFALAREAEVCPFEVSLELSRESQVVVGDYNYAFDPIVSLGDFARDADLSDVILIVDEIHNLVDRGRGYYSPALDSDAIRRVAELTKRGGAPVHERIAGLCRDLAGLIEETADIALEAGATAAETALPEDDLLALRADFDDAFVEFLEHRKETSSFRADDPFVGLYFDLLRFLSVLQIAIGDAFSHYVERSGEGVTMKILCKDASRLLGATLNRCHSVVGLSATLSPTEFYRDLLGFDPDRFAAISLPSPFPAEHRSFVIDDSVATTYRERPEQYPRIAARLGQFAERVPGNCLVLLPSFVFLDEIARRLTVKSKRLLTQTRNGNDRDREQILEALRSPLAGDTLLLAVAGGVFAEGVDYPGEMLKAVAVVGPCLPAVSLERDLLRRYYEDHYQRGFEYAYVVPGMTRVVQAAGRLIRSETDSGVIALLDERFLRFPYLAFLPEEWSPDGRPESLAGAPAEAAGGFFRELSPK